MTPAFLAHRRADAFDALVEGTSTQVHETDRDLRLLEVVGALRGVPQVQARPDFVAGLREQLMAEAQTALVPTDDVSRLKLPARHTPRERRLAAVVGSIAIVGATTSLAVASQSALPGESLYPIKRVIESAHTSISVGEADKGHTMLGNASSRLDEATALSHDPGFGDDLEIADTLNTFTDQATSAADLLFADYAHTGRQSSIAQLRDFASTSLDRLEALEPLVPYDARDELISAAAVLAQIDSEAAQRCPACGGTPIQSIPPTLTGAEFITVPDQPTATTAVHRHAGAAKHGHQQGGKNPALPDVQSNQVPPGSVLNPSGAPSTDPSGAANPLKTLTDGLTGGGKSASGGSVSNVPIVGGVVQGLDDILQGVVDPLTGKTEKQ